MKILVADDDKNLRKILKIELSEEGLNVEEAESGTKAIDLLDKNDYDVLLLDLNMPGLGGMDVLEKVKAGEVPIEIIVLTGHSTVPTAVQAMKLGAYDFLLKPISPDAIELVVERVAEVIRLRQEVKQFRSDVANSYQNIVGKSSKMKQIYDLIETTADARSTVLITGESGTGKELFARAVHYASCRKDKPFIKLNCAALPENLVEAEMFGYEKGAFTGAVRQHKGRFELAHTGTLLLDEISEMPLGLQAKLLRVLQEKEFERVGSGATISVDVRIIATSNRNLKEAISEKKFREDLYFRLNVIPLHILPLRERLEDIPLLTSHFIQKSNAENKKNVQAVDENVIRLFMKYHWPGNVRELENYVERAVVTTSGTKLTQDDFPKDLVLGKLADEVKALRADMTLAEGEKYLILKTLQRFEGNKTRAAEALNITPRTIRNKLAEYNIEDRD